MKYIDKLSSKQKLLIIFLFDTIIAAISFPTAVIVHSKDFNFSNNLHHYALISLASFILKAIYIRVFKLHKGVWSFSSIIDLIKIVKIALSSLVTITCLHFFTASNLELNPGVLITDFMLFIFMIGGARLCYRLLKERSTSSTNTGLRTLIIGAGRAGEQLIREIKNTPTFKIQVIGLLDDDLTKHNRYIHNIPVLGNIQAAGDLVEKLNIENVLIAIPSAKSSLLRSINDNLLEFKIPVQTLPGLSDIAGGKVQISQLRPINVEDLLGRKPIDLDIKKVDEFITGKTVLVTGAGGSIGSDLCKQIAKRNPKALILFEICEFFIYKIDLELREQFPNLNIIPIVGDVKEENRVNEIFSEYRPDVVFHAAAYKHVPMMELNPLEALKTNVIGTSVVAEAAGRFTVQSFVLVSTDKAVRPTNIMGASKRMAELQVQSLQKLYPNTKYGTVRFGNVLGSNGSVIPRFMEQIKKGGPVTVTHPEITRYFMSIPEATQLVLQAGSMTKGGEVFVLDMGEPVKIINLAKDLIRLCGLEPDKDIELKFTGLRPAEKLYEELIFDEENTLPTPHPLLRVVKGNYQALDLNIKISEMLDKGLNKNEIKEFIKSIVCEFGN